MAEIEREEGEKCGEESVEFEEAEGEGEEERIEEVMERWGNKAAAIPSFISESEKLLALNSDCEYRPWMVRAPSATRFGCHTSHNSNVFNPELMLPSLRASI